MKRTEAGSETLYFNSMWTWHHDAGIAGQYSKNIYLGSTRLVTKQTSHLEASYGQSEELHNQYYYHPDHLGSAQLITDYNGEEYQRLEYTPDGEIWIEKASNLNDRYLPYKFTGKERDEETGLYYYGARYLDAKYSRWLSTDPALSDYIPQAGGDNSNLSGMGGVFNIVNLQLYHYAGNNPVKYVDPDGREETKPVYFTLDPDQFIDVSSLRDSVFANLVDKTIDSFIGKKYITPNASNNWKGFQCDDFVERVLESNNINTNNYMSGKASEKNVQNHIDFLVSNDKATEYKKSEAPSLTAGVYVTYMNNSNILDPNTGKPLAPHAGIITIDSLGLITYSDNNKKNPNNGVYRNETYNSMQEFQSAYGYGSFYYIKVTGNDD